jgi:hypothetical protein
LTYVEAGLVLCNIQICQFEKKNPSKCGDIEQFFPKESFCTFTNPFFFVLPNAKKLPKRRKRHW